MKPGDRSGTTVYLGPSDDRLRPVAVRCDCGTIAWVTQRLWDADAAGCLGCRYEARRRSRRRSGRGDRVYCGHTEHLRTLIRQATKRAVNSGRLTRPADCQVCGFSKRIYAHHDDYSKPLEILWLCASCHGYRHADLREAGLDPTERHHLSVIAVREANSPAASVQS